jgi:KUP system potassium uptake protein
VRLKTRDYLENIAALRSDARTPLCADNLVYIDKGDDPETLDRDILYSILDRAPKRACAYWFFSIHLMDEPDVARYHLETYGTDYIFRVRLELGFKNDQFLNAYLRQIVGDLLDSGELPPQEKPFSIYGPSSVGTFKFGFIRRSVASGTELTRFEEFILTAKYRIRELIGSQIHWYGLDTSPLIIESVPLSAPRRAANTKPVRVQ